MVGFRGSRIEVGLCVQFEFPRDDLKGEFFFVFFFVVGAEGSAPGEEGKNVIIDGSSGFTIREVYVWFGGSLHVFAWGCCPG